jgi:hypothetical protein
MNIKDEEKISTSNIAGAGIAERSPDHHADENAVAAVDGPRLVDDVPAPLFANEEAEGYRSRWSGIQTGFVDEPRKAVEEADTLVAEVMKHLAEGFAGERRQLESQWERTDHVSTEDLRLAMRRYRSFFERLLAI